MVNPFASIGRAVARGFRNFTRARWWVHVLVTFGAGVFLILVALVVAAALYLDFVREHGPLASDIPVQSSPEPDERVELAQRFAPILRYHSKELFGPIPRWAYVGLSQLKEQEGRFVRVKDPKPTVETLPEAEGSCLRNRGCLYFLDIRGVEPDPPKKTQRAYGPIEKQLLRTGAKPTVYSHVTRYDDTGEYAVQYWFLYLFNFRLNEHESDWEQITIRLDADKQPIDAFYSAHEGGDDREWDGVQREGDHPVVYPALGSHANYFEAAAHRVRVGCRRVIGSIQQCLRSRTIRDLADGKGTTLQPADYEVTEIAGPLFIGSYGTGNYLVLTRRPSVLSDPRARGAWADPLGPLR